MFTSLPEHSDDEGLLSVTADAADLVLRIDLAKRATSGHEVLEMRLCGCRDGAMLAKRLEACIGKALFTETYDVPGSMMVNIYADYACDPIEVNCDQVINKMFSYSAADLRIRACALAARCESYRQAEAVLSRCYNGLRRDMLQFIDQEAEKAQVIDEFLSSRGQGRGEDRISLLKRMRNLLLAAGGDA